jgi:hypothetical protein
MSGFALLSLRRELALTSRRLLIAVRLHRRLARLGTEDSADDSLPSALECLRLIENRTAEYLAVLTRYRVALEKALPRRPGPMAPRMGASSRTGTGPHACEVRRPARQSNATFESGRRRRG